jgi:hypothetical protein
MPMRTNLDSGDTTVDTALIRSKYAQIRAYGVDLTTALHLLQDDLLSLEIGERERLVEELKNWEPKPVTNGDSYQYGQPSSRPSTPGSAATNVPVTRPNEIHGHDLPAENALNRLDTDRASHELQCGNCGAANPPRSKFCNTCGTPLKQADTDMVTQRLADPGQLPLAKEFFGGRTILVLSIRGTSEIFAVRPQDYGDEVIIGRDPGNPRVLNVGTAAQSAAELGVSRFHVGVRYHPARSRLTVKDLGSTNGTFVNGRRLYEEETLVLCHGDQLRLARLDLEVFFFHLPLMGSQMGQFRGPEAGFAVPGHQMPVDVGSAEPSQQAIELDHEMRESLAAMLASIELLQHYELRLPAERRDECLRDIKDQINRVVKLVEENSRTSKRR